MSATTSPTLRAATAKGRGGRPPAEEAERLDAALEAGLTGYTYLDDTPLA